MKDARKESYETNKLAKRIRRQVGEAIGDFSMIEEGDRIMVACRAARTVTGCWMFYWVYKPNPRLSSS